MVSTDRAGGHAARRLLHDARFADACLTRQQDDLPFAALRQFPAFVKQAEFVLAPDKTGERTGVGRLEAAITDSFADD